MTFDSILYYHNISVTSYHIAQSAGVAIAFDPSVVTVDEGSAGSVCAIITGGTIDRSVSITFNILENTGTASSPCE